MNSVQLISLLQHEIEWAIITTKKTGKVQQFPPFVWDGKEFYFGNGGKKTLKFTGMHQKLIYDFKDQVKNHFVQKFAQQLQTFNTEEKSDRTIIFIPTSWPEWLVQNLLMECRRLELGGINILRSAFLAVLSDALKAHKNTDTGTQNGLSFMSASEYKNGVFHLAKTAEENVPFESLSGIIRTYLTANIELWGASWPLTLGLIDPSGEWWELITEEDTLPIRRYFCFLIPPKQTRSVVNILAQCRDGFRLEVLNIELPENTTARPLHYSLKLEFGYSWSGKAIVRCEDQFVQERSINLPFFSYLQ